MPDQPQKEEIKVAELSTDEKIVIIIRWLDYLSKDSVKQTQKLSSINSILSVFLVLMIIGIFFQGCSALGLM